MRHEVATERDGSGWPVAGLVACLVFAPGGVRAQHWQVDASAGAVTTDTGAGLAAASLVPTVSWYGRDRFGQLLAAVTGYDRGAWAAHAAADGLITARPLGWRHPVRFDLRASAEGTAHSAPLRTAAAYGEARVHLWFGPAGVWAGLAGAAGWTSADPGGVGAAGPTAGAWIRRGPMIGQAVVQSRRISGAWYTDITGEARWTRGPMDAMVYAGWRPGQGAVAPRTWAGGTLTWWFAPHLAATGSGGSYPGDLLQGLANGRYLSIGLRFAGGRSIAGAGVWRSHSFGEFEAESGLLRFTVPGAERVAIVGDWTGWQPVSLVRSAMHPGIWLLEVPPPPGVHRFNLVVDGERWIVPQGILTARDDYGGEVGILIIPGP